MGGVCVHLVGHCEPVTLPRFFKGLQTVDVKAGFSVDTVNRLLHDVIRYDFAATESICVGAIDIAPAEFTAALLSAPATDHLFQREPPPAQSARQVRVKGRKGNRPFLKVLERWGIRLHLLHEEATDRFTSG